MPKKTKIITTILSLVVLFAIYSAKYIFAANEYHASDYTTLVNAINTANNGDIIVVDNNILLTSTLSTTKQIKIMGSSNFKLSLQPGSYIRHINANANLEIDNLTLDGGGTGGGIQVNYGSITVTNSNFINNRTSGYGAAIYLPTVSTSNITNSTFKNSTAYEGGAIYTQGSINITNCEFDNNKNTHDEKPQGIQGQYTNINGGGAICAINNSNVKIESSIFTNNVTSSRGGAVYVNGSITVTGSLFQNNKNINFTYDTGYGGAIYAARSNGTFNVDKCQFTGNSSGAAGGIASFIPLTVTNSCFESNVAVGEHGADILFGVTNAYLTNCTFSNYIGSSIVEWDNPLEYNNTSYIPTVIATNCTFWNKNLGTGVNDWFYENIERMHYNNKDGNSIPSRWSPTQITISYYGCILSVGGPGSHGATRYLEDCIGYRDSAVDRIFMSNTPTLNYHDTNIILGTGATTLQIGYYPIKPFGRADDKIDSTKSWAQKKDQNGVSRGQAYTDGRTLIDVGAIEELGNIYDKKDSGDNQTAIVNTAFQDPLKVQVYYDSTTQPGIRVFLKDFVFTSISPTPAANGASATLSASTVNTDDNGFAQVTATANDKIGQYPVTFVPNDNYNGRVIVPVAFVNDSTNYFDNIIFTLTNISKTIHVRQVVINGVDELEAPNQGYIRLSSSDLTDISNLTVDSGKNELGVNYTTFLMNAKPKTVYGLSPIIPEYYDYAGYIMTNTDTPHDPSSITFPGYPTIDFTNSTSAEYWITIYITPKSPDTYSWSDAVNDFFKQK